MPSRKIQELLSSGEVTEIYVGGNANTNKSVIFDEIKHLPYEPSYCSCFVTPNMILTNQFQVVKNWSHIVTPVGISYDNSNGNFTAEVDGVYEWSLERVYTNSDISPSSPITISIEAIADDSTVVFTRSAIIGAATKRNEPAIVSFTTPFIYEVTAGSKFKFAFKAVEGTGNPSSTRLTRVQLKANKIYNKM